MLYFLGLGQVAQVVGIVQGAKEKKLGKEVTASTAGWVVQAKLTSKNFLSNSTSTSTIGVEDIGQEEMKNIGSKVKGTELKEGQDIAMDMTHYYMNFSLN